MNEGPRQIEVLLASAAARDALEATERRLQEASERIAAKIEPIMRDMAEPYEKALQRAEGGRIVYDVEEQERDAEQDMRVIAEIEDARRAV